MPLKNYTSEMDADRSIQQIQKILSRMGAAKIMTDYTEGIISSISFALPVNDKIIGFHLPCDWRKVYAVLVRDKECRYSDPELIAHWESQNRLQAVRTAWKIVLDWIAAQMAIIETEMVKTEQVFLPYMLTSENETLYEKLSNNQFLLADGK